MKTQGSMLLKVQEKFSINKKYQNKTKLFKYKKNVKLKIM